MADKLMAPLGGLPLLDHAIGTVSAIPFARRIAVCGESLRKDWEKHGFTHCDVGPDRPLSHSIAAAIATIMDADCMACMILLADMPFVPPCHIERLMEGFDGDVIASVQESGGQPMVPAIFARDRWPQLAKLEGDRGARALLAGCPTVVAPDHWLRDVDTVQDLADAQGIIARL